MNKYPWIIYQYKDLIHKYYKNKLHPIILIQSIIGIGTSQLIFNLSKWILCSNKKKYTNCNNCSSCLLFDKKNHPDFYNCDNFSKNKYIGINIIRKIINNIYKTPQQGGAKIVYFPNINIFTTESDNALLKTLEEPPKNTIFFLRTTNITKIINTIKSRSTLYYINYPKEKLSIPWLKNHNKYYSYIELLTALRINNNSPISTHKFLNNYEFQKRNIFMQEIYAYVNKKKNNLLNIMLKYNSSIITKYVCYLLLDVIKYKICKKYKIKNLDQIKLIKKIAYINNNQVLINNLISWTQYTQILSSSYKIDKTSIFIELILSWMNILRI
ncbi:DNA polymerase III subunit delta' C-terminal domain-containing protein [Buchnera aphidicola]|uniref:DNA polymerase III subunit delta' n=1 Tax=Buchnera aphidicola (Cinara laricifoliae) TaxID=2518977 RepID=A0A451DBH8_9GAMM|nr:DNA polymerase III subunit delta' C-terminal domain-containing protein [Buchnera aphidicola]VFP83714.1 DNA polymerase III subunit delta' [Buchnera aphidicola (Cinara laricifoliae)]